MSKKYFLLLNKDVEVAVLSVNRGEISVLFKEEKILRRDLIPRDMREIQKWIEGRYVLSYRNDIRVFFRMLGISCIEDFIEITNCVSLKDTYWVKSLNSRKTWKDVSPYSNPLNKLIADYSFSRKINGKTVTGSPDFSTDGNFPKCWKRVNGELYLYKAGSSGACNAGNEPYSEVYASMIAKRMGIQTVNYDISTYKGVTVSRCKCMTNENIGLISYRELYDSQICDFKELLNSVPENCKRNIVDMLLLDYVTCNIDRHYGNIGLLISNETNKVLGFSPLYDHNLSCIPYYIESDDIEAYINSQFAKDGRTWSTLFGLVDCSYTRAKLRKLVGVKFNLGYKRDRIVNKMIRIQLNRVLRSDV